jgi:hypothetical protein
MLPRLHVIQLYVTVVCIWLNKVFIVTNDEPLSVFSHDPINFHFHLFS